MNVADNLMLYFQAQATALPTTQKAPATSFREQLEQVKPTKPTDENSTEKEPQTDTVGKGETAEVQPEQEVQTQQLLAAAAVAPATLQIIDMTGEQAPVQAAPVQTAPVQAAPIETKAMPQAPAQQTMPTVQVETAAQTQTQTSGTVTQGTEVASGELAQPIVQAAEQPETNSQPDSGSDTMEGQSARGKTKEQPEVLAATTQEAPVFREVKATPIKVGDAQTIDTEQGDVGGQLAKQVEGALQSGEDRVVIRLTPENLGTVTVELTRSADGALHVSLSATGSKTLGLLEKHVSGMETMLASSQQTSVRVEVQHSQENAQTQNGHPYDREGQGGEPREQRNPQQRRQPETQDFLQQLRLGLVPADAAIS